MNRPLTKTLNTFILLGLLSFSSLAANGSEAITPKNEAASPVETHKLISRLEEIDSMEKKGLTTAEKKELRKEVRSIKEELRRLGGGVYISVGAILIILLLLIILL